ncbi:Hypothetical_protein [Hexamita inflata]|uniref:Hypothetical_protein n=1 Tax=Hexamita inflata TaxID=28002 RepID=A0ABP1HNL8_9EUKA
MMRPASKSVIRSIAPHSYSIPSRQSFNSFGSLRNVSRTSFCSENPHIRSSAQAPPLSNSNRSNSVISDVDLELSDPLVDFSELKQFAVFSLKAELTVLANRLVSVQSILVAHVQKIENMRKFIQLQFIEEENRKLFTQESKKKVWKV